VAQFLPSSAPDGSIVLRVIGELDLVDIEELKSAVRPFLAESRAVELDMSGLEFIDSSGLGALVQLRSEAHAQGVSLVLRDMRANIHRLFEVTGLTGVFEARSSAQDSGHGAVS